jgi:uncharacterized coiled-coil protein SlyX
VPSNLSDDSDAIEVLQTKLSFVEDALQQLSDVLVAQQQRMDRLEGQLELLVSQLRNQAEPGPQEEPPPPHY